MRIQHLDGIVYNLSGYGIREGVENLSAPSFSLFREQVGNKVLILGSEFESRTFEKEFLIQAVDYVDLKLLHQEMFGIFRSDKPIYIIDDVIHIGTRLRVQVTSLDLKKITHNVAVMTVQFDVLSPFRESTGTTQMPLTTDIEVWQLGQALYTDTEYQYSFTGTGSQTIYNAGDVTIDSRQQFCVLTVTGATTNLKIKNHKNDILFQLNKTTNANSVVKIESTRVTENGISVFKQTNKGYIALYPGENIITVEGATSGTRFDWDFRYYYR